MLTFVILFVTILCRASGATGARMQKQHARRSIMQVSTLPIGTNIISIFKYYYYG